MPGSVVWITGLSAAGKTTLGEELTKRIRETREPVIFLDGDSLREILGEHSTHSRDDRLRLAFIYSRLCKSLALQNTNVVISTVALFHEVHRWNRDNLPKFLEVFLDVPMTELRRRDPKRIYERFENGEISNVAGLDLEVDFPREPHFHFRYIDGVSLNDMVQKILMKVMRNNDYSNMELNE
jgi:adenylylsulfate kinase